MKFQVLLLVFCIIVSPTMASFLSWIPLIAEKALPFFKIGIKEISNQQLECYQCSITDEKEVCAQGNAIKCEMRSLLPRFGSFLKSKFLGKPIVMPVCLRAEIEVGEKLVTYHSCAMVNKGDALDETTCKSSLYMLGGVSGSVGKCELCDRNKCNTHQPPTPRAQLQTWNPYIQSSALVRDMQLGHVQYDVQSMRYTSNAATRVASFGLLISTVLFYCIKFIVLK